MDFTKMTIAAFLLFVVFFFIVGPIVLIWRDAHWRKKMDKVMTDLESFCAVVEDDVRTLKAYSHNVSSHLALPHYASMVDTLRTAINGYKAKVPPPGSKS